MDIAGKTALVTGAAKRVGKEIALALARKGASILLHYHASKAEAEKTCGEIRALGVDCRALSADLSRTAEVKRLLSETDENARAVDILVNSASVFYKTPIQNVTEEDFDRLLSSNLKGPFFLAKELGARMRERGGQIVNIADWSAFRPYRDYAPYCASKGALVTLTKALARDFAPNVRVNAVAPGPVLLPEGFTAEEKAAISKLTALGRIGTPADVAYAVVYILENDYVNGTILVVDGGRSLI